MPSGTLPVGNGQEYCAHLFINCGTFVYDCGRVGSPTDGEESLFALFWINPSVIVFMD